MNEKTVLKSSIYVFLVGCLLASLCGLIFHDISYIFGFILGYIINVIVFLLNMKMVEGILKFSMSSAIIAIIFISKLVLYGLGFYIATRFIWIHIAGVFFGYMVCKVAIYLEEYLSKRR